MIVHSVGEFTFVVKCHLQDATGELDAMLLGNEGSAFFSVCSSSDDFFYPTIWNNEILP